MGTSQTLQSILDAPMEHLARLGLRQPPGYTLGRFLRLVAAQGALSGEAVEGYLEVRERVAFATDKVPPDLARSAAEAVTKELASLAGAEERLARVTLALHPPPPEPVVAAAPVEDDAAPEWPEPPAEEDDDGVPASPELENFALPALGRWRRPALLTGLVLWSVLMVLAGYLGRDLIDSAAGEIGYRFFGRPRFTRLELLRQRAGENPDDLGAWRAWADGAARAGNETETIVALQYLVARRPDDPALLNRLAWLYLTADSAHARNPRQALTLAERAHALSPTPAITDTLAEAAFQNGDSARAVALEERALAEVNGGREFYQRQLEKFRAGLER